VAIVAVAGGLCLLCGVGAQQVMEPVAAVSVLGQQVRGGQFVQRAAGLVGAGGGEAGRGRNADVRPGMHP
jgi:hypothetical protein